MKKKIILILLILIMEFIVIPVIAQTNGELYTIQLGVYGIEKNADNFIVNLNKYGLNVYKISTSIHSVFYGIYTDKDQASDDLKKVRGFIKDAYVVKLNEKQRIVYLEEMSLGKDVISKTDEEVTESTEEINTNLLEETKQITISKTPTGDLEYTYRVLDDIELRGINGESKWFFNLEEGMKIEKFKFKLFVRVNELIRADISYFTVYMNDVPVKSMKIKNKNNEFLNNWEILIPVNLIQEGYNELKVSSHSRLSDNPCEDDKNIANWVIIDRNTNYVIDYSKVFSSTNIADFPKPFVGLYADDAQGIGVAIPEDYTNNELSAALTLIAHLKDYSFAYAVPSTLIRSNDASISDFDSLIYLGNYNSIPEELKGIAFQNQAKLSAENTYLYKSTFDDKQKPVFMIISDNDENLVEAVRALNNIDLKAQMDGNYIVLNSDLDTNIKEERISGYIYLEDLGINGIEVKGTNQQIANIGLRIPSDQILANESNINLRLRYSDNLDFEKSMVSVYVNGIPIGSQKLERDKRDLDIMTFYIPESLRRNYYFDIRIVFELIPAGIINCERYLKSEPWAYILKDSNYFFPTQERDQKLFTNLPFPFVKNDDLDDTTIVMPDKPAKEDFRIAGKIAELAGIGVKKNKGIIKAITGSVFNEKDHENNLIIFGTPEENSAIRIINKDLWFQYNTRFSTILSNEKIELLPETATTATYLELKTSPYNEDKGIMTLTSLDKESIIKAIEYFEDSKRGFLTGDAAMISKEGDLQTFRFQKDEDERPKIGIIQNITKSLRDYLIFAGVLVLFLIISLGLYLNKNRRRKK